MDRREAGKQRTEKFVAAFVHGLNLAGDAPSLLWWPTDRLDDTTVLLRLYRGTSWRAIAFAGADVDGSVGDPGVLAKYEQELAEVMAEL
jgi:hypothetical protein